MGAFSRSSEKKTSHEFRSLLSKAFNAGRNSNASLLTSKSTFVPIPNLNSESSASLDASSHPHRQASTTFLSPTTFAAIFITIISDSVPSL